MTEQRDPDRLADELEHEADRMRARSEELEGRIADVRDDWERKRASDAVPGAPPREQDTDRDAPGDEVNPEDAGRQQHQRPDEPERTEPEQEP
jgi:hypothetical protein